MIVTGSIMRPIGWTLACALLATTFPKSAILSDVQSVGVAAGYQREAGRAKVTKLLPISKVATVDPDIQELRKFLDDLFVGGTKKIRGKRKVDVSRYYGSEERTIVKLQSIRRTTNRILNIYEKQADKLERLARSESNLC